MSYHQRYPPIVAPQACTRCKERKRKCDKLLPNCSRCERYLLNCCYASNDISRISRIAGTGRQRPPNEKNRITRKVPLSGIPPPSVIDPEAGPDLLTSSLLLSSLSLTTPGTRSVASESIIAQVSNLIASESESTKILKDQYFQTVNFWLPIISAENFDKELQDNKTGTSVEAVFVLLCMCLIIRTPSQKDEMRDSLYFSAKVLYLGLTSAGKSSLRLIQGGILITLYEQGHGFIEASQVSLGNCALMWATLRGQTTQHTGENAIYTEEGRLGWAIVLLESFSMICSNSHEIPCNTEHPHKMIPLPKFQEMWCDAAYLSPLPPYATLTSSRPTMALASSCYATQAALMVGRTQKVISKSSIDPDFDAEAGLLEKDQQKLLKTLFEHATRQWEECYVAIALCLSSIFALQRTLHRIGSCATGDSHSRRAAAVLSIRTALNICVDINQSRSISVPKPNVPQWHRQLSLLPIKQLCVAWNLGRM